MNRWVINILQAESTIAVEKPKSDVTLIAEKMDYRRINIRIRNTRGYSSLELESYFEGLSTEISATDILLYQYPTLMGSRFDEAYINYLVKKGVNVVVLIHDSEAIRGNFPGEINLFNSARVVIGHGLEMGSELKNRGLNTPYIQKELFDYIHDTDIQLSQDLKKELVIAGNLDKSIFIEHWDNLDIPLIAFGSKSVNSYGKGVTYKGALLSKELLIKIPKDCFGVSWDDKLPGGGDYQAYTKYNSPHKVSLYLSLGLPVVVWQGSSISSFIVKNKLGISIKSIEELPEKLNTLTADQCKELKNNSNKISLLLRNGMFTRNAIMEAEFLVFDS